jgi:predicted kinase
MSKCYQLIGVPGAGKSTWVSEQSWAKDCAYISTDQYVEEYAKARGETYNQVFKEVMPDCVKYMTGDVVNARVAGQDVIWDQTSTTVNSRKKKFNMLPNYDHIAVVFRTPPREVLEQRLASRPGKLIPMTVMTNMIENFDEPTEEEGFKEIWYV